MILTTISSDKIPNAAPMGLHRKNRRLFLRIYHSKTLNNIQHYPIVGVNIVDDPVLFVRSALSVIEASGFDYVDHFPVLKEALGWILCDCIHIKKDENVCMVELSPIKGKIIKRIIKPVNRGFNAVIEAAIHATRYVSLKEQRYLDCIEYYNTIVNKCGGKQEKEAMKLIHKLI